MDVEKLDKERRQFAQRLVMTTGVLLVSVATNLVLGLQLMNTNKIILVPTLTNDVAIEINGSANADYLEKLALDMAFLFLNRTTQTARYMEERGQKYIDPETFEQLRLQLANESRKATDLHQTQSFEPLNIFVDAKNLYVEVTGNLTITNGQTVVDNQQKIFAMQFSKKGSIILLKAIAEIEPDKARSKPSSIQSTVGGY